MRVRLVVERGSRRKDVFTMKTTTMLIGRKEGVSLRVPSAEVSRRHCRLTIEDGFVVVEDLKSANGTFLNDQEVRGRVIARPGDRLTVGPVTFVVEYELTQEAVERLAQIQSESQYPELELVEDSLARPIRLGPDEPIPMDDSDLAVPVADNEPASVEMFEFDNVEEMELPQEGNFRDFLSQLDQADD